MDEHSSAATGPVVRVGLISDTHGVFDPRVRAALAGSDVIVHAGDIGKVRVLEELELIAPRVVGVLGNCDFEDYGWGLRLEELADIDGLSFLVMHYFPDGAPVPSGVDVLVCGHTHRPRIERQGDVLIVNPGSATLKREMPSRSVAMIEIGSSGLTARIIRLDDIESRLT